MQSTLRLLYLFVMLTRSSSSKAIVTGLKAGSSVAQRKAAIVSPLLAEGRRRQHHLNRFKTSISAISKNGNSQKNNKRKVAAVISDGIPSRSNRSDERAAIIPKKIRPNKKEQEAAKNISRNNNNNVLLSLPDDMVLGEFVCRPSKRNRSPYVADVYLVKEDREVLVHVPNLDMGGKCQPGVTLLMKPARDRKGNLVGKDAINPKFQTPKCEFIAQLLYVDESHLSTDTIHYEKTWVGAHPSLGEKIAEQLVGRNLLGAEFPKVKSFQREVSNVGGTDMRTDFLIEHEDPTQLPRVLEVKTVVDTDYHVSAVPTSSLEDDNEKNKTTASSKKKKKKKQCLFTSDESPYDRTAIFPWGNSNQKGPDGEKVVSARAIKHVREITKLVQSQRYAGTILFVVIRGDAAQFRPNYEACPSFAKYLQQAKNAGVQILAKQVTWGSSNTTTTTNDTDNNEEKIEDEIMISNVRICYEGNLLDIQWPPEAV